MKQEPKDMAEWRGLFASTLASCLIGCVGIGFAILSGSQAIMLDGLFNLAFFVTSLITLKVASLMRRGDTIHFPFGYAFFEPLVNGFKGVLILGVSLMALADALDSLFTGGRMISPGLATVYGIFATTACTMVAYITYRTAKKSGSPLLQTDASNWIVNTAISSAVLLTFLSIFLIRGSALEHLIPYIDPALIVVLVVVSIFIPVRIAWKALMELLNRTPSSDLQDKVEATIQKAVEDLPVQQLTVRVIQPGRSRMIAGHIVLSPEFALQSLEKLGKVKLKAYQMLQADYSNTTLDLIFTSDSRWGAPLGTHLD